MATKVPTVAGGTRTANFVTGEDGGSLALLVLAPVVLLAAGALLARGRATADDYLDGAKAGSTAVLGYLPLCVGAALLSTHAIGDTDATIAPDLVTAVLLAGVVYPVVFGTLGGVVASFAE